MRTCHVVLVLAVSAATTETIGRVPGNGRYAQKQDSYQQKETRKAEHFY